MMMAFFLVFFISLIIGDVAKMSDRPMKNSGNVFRFPSFFFQVNVPLFGKTGLNENSVVMHFECVDNAF